MKTKIFLTGAAGFIGSELARQIVHLDYDVTVIDKLTYAGDVARLGSVQKAIRFEQVDICDRNALEKVFKKEKPQKIIHFAAETHVDRSIIAHDEFLQTNILGTQHLIDLSRKYGVEKFYHISTDEVYGESRKGRFKENAPLTPGNPYSASKASGDLLIQAAIRTHKFPAVIIRPCNNYGHWQYPEKFIPVIIFKALNNERIPVYGRGQHIREWLHVSDCAQAILTVVKKGTVGEIYNIGSYFETENINVVYKILNVLKKSKSLIQFVQDRSGHDFRYSVDCGKLRKMGWRPKITFDQGVVQTVDWYLNNAEWLERKRKFLQNYWNKVYKPLQK